MISLQKIIKVMETQPKTPEKRGEIVDLQISFLEVLSKKKGENRRSSDIFFKGLNRRSVRVSFRGFF